MKNQYNSGDKKSSAKRGSSDSSPYKGRGKSADKPAGKWEGKPAYKPAGKWDGKPSGKPAGKWDSKPGYKPANTTPRPPQDTGFERVPFERKSVTQEYTEAMREMDENIAVGRNGVVELLKSGREVECIYLSAEPVEGKAGAVSKIIALSKQRGIPIKNVASQKIDSLAPGMNHQGVAALAAAFKYSEITDIFENAGENQPFIIVADGIEDPHNLGAIIRTAEAAGAHGIIIPKRHGVGLTPTVSKTSAGAVEHIPVVRVTNLTETIEVLKEKGVWIFATDMDGVSYEKSDFTGSIALVIGSEGTGVSRLLKSHCDYVVSLPMCGKINSLNASVAAGIVMYEVVRQRAKL